VSTELTDPLESKVKEIVAEQLGVPAEEIALDSTFTSDLGADALDQVELIMAFEEEFDIDIDDDDAEKLRTVQDVIDFVAKRVQ
jgi:acyl carrier protein